MVLNAADRWEVLWSCGERVAAEGWDPSVSASGILTALALVCTQTSYMHVSLFTAPPPPLTHTHPVSRSSHSTHLSFQRDHTRVRDTHANTNTWRARVKQGEGLMDFTFTQTSVVIVEAPQ